MKFEKEILTEGLYVTGDGKGGRKVELITGDRINHWVKQHRKMVEAGLDITAPAIHENKANPEKKSDPDRWSNTPIGSKSNYGFWEELSVADGTDDQGNPTKVLKGVVDVPREEDVSRIGKTAKSTSIYAKDFLDGDGNLWKDVLTHIYIGNNTIEAGQKNFEPLPVEEGALSVAMSHRLPISMDMSELSGFVNSDDNGMANSDDLYEMLEKVAGISIPKGTSDADLAQALLAALKQKQLSDSHREGGTVDKPPKDSQLHEVPVVMSQNQQTDAGAADQTAVTDQQIADNTIAMSQLQNTNAGLMNVATTNKKSELKNRLVQLRQRGIIASDEDLQQYNEQVDAITSMSFNDSYEVIPDPVEIEIRALEKVKIPMPKSQPMVAMAQQDDLGNFVIQPNPTPPYDPGQGEVTDERADEIVNGLLGDVPA